MTRLSTLPSSLLLLVFSGIFHIPNVAGATDYTLSSFDSTQTSGLTPACNTVYTSTIQGCQPSDFSAINPCSAGCIQSLQSIQTEAQAACNGQTIPQQSMLSYFRDGQGVNELCTNLKQVATTLRTATSTSVPTATGQPSQTTPALTETPSPSSTAQAQTTGMLGLSRPALLAVIIAIVIALAIFFLIAVLMFRKHYRK